MNKFWTKFNKMRIEKLSKKLIFYNRKYNIKYIRINHYNMLGELKNLNGNFIKINFLSLIFFQHD